MEAGISLLERHTELIVEKTQYSNPQTSHLFNDIGFEDRLPCLFINEIGGDKGELGFRTQFGEKFKAHHQIFLPHVDHIVSHVVIRLDEEIDAEKRIPALGFVVKRFSKEKISGVEEEDILSFLFHLGDESGFLGHTAKRVSESPAGLDLTHHVVRINDTELVLGFSFSKGV